VAGDCVTAATAALSQDGFRVTTGPQENSNTVAKGLVAGTSPAGRALKGSTIAIMVSAGPFTSVVPTVRGETLAAAKSALAGVHLSTLVMQVGSTLPKGTVTGTTPKAGTTWPQTQPVTILVAGGLPMPNFVGMQKAAAASLAASDHLTVSYATGTSGNWPAGAIIRQSVGKGTIMTAGETVTLTVSTGPPGVQLPDVIGQGIQAAKVTLEELGFKVAVQGEDFFGTVEDETPTPAGQTEPYGSIITLTVDAFGGLGGGNGGGGNGGGGNGGGGGGIIGGL
jgi:beta-lactam-binding protein with PASTA domain